MALGGLLGGQPPTLFRTEELAPSKRHVKAIRPGGTVRVDNEYEGSGTANLFTLFAPLEGWLPRQGGDGSPYRPKHGSWLDLAESELEVLTTQCLDRRIPNKQTLIDEIAARQQERNANHTKADGHFTANDARIKLNRPRVSRAKPAVKPLPRGRPAKGSKP